METYLIENMPKSIEIHITEAMINQYIRASHDDQPIHTSTSAAIDAGFPKKVAHGMLIMAISSQLVSPILGKQWMVQSFQTKFQSPVFVNDRMIISRSAISIEERKFIIKIIGKNQRNKRVMNGNVVLIKR